MSDNWNKKNDKETKKIMPEVNFYIEPVAFDVERTVVRSQPLPFYPDYELLELTDMSYTPAAKKFVIYKEGDINVIDWTNSVIYEVNEKAPILLNKETIIPYLRFFFEYVYGRYGKFTIVETEYDIKWQTEPPLQGRKVIQEMLKPVQIVEETSDGGFKLSGFVSFKDSLFSTEIFVDGKGTVDMNNEELKIEGMPLMQDVAF